MRTVAPDGVELVADVFDPDGRGPFPTLLQRTCYGRQWFAGTGRWFAERGYRVVIQDCRGSGESGGEPDFFAEAADGRATADHIAGQPWFDGRLATFGPSYMGFTQWALASTRPPYLRAMSIGLASSERRRSWYPGGSFALDLALPWTVMRTRGVESVGDPEAARRTREALDHQPLRTADEVALGEPVGFYRAWLDHPEPGDPYWAPLDFREVVASIGVPVLFWDGWWDYQLPHLIEDFARTPAQVPARLVVGPWSHAGFDDAVVSAETLAWFDRHVKGVGADPGPVRVFVPPDDGWRELEAWPPAGRDVTVDLRPPEPVRFTYDPADPTPAFGGISLSFDNAGPVDNRPLEARPDVAVLTADPFPADLVVAGPVSAEVDVQVGSDHADVFVRVCDVAPDGTSVNVTDAIRRLRPGEPTRPLRLDLWPTARRFAAGHRVRVIVAGGAHPLFARNTCSGESLADATTLVAVDYAVHRVAVTFSEECR